MRPTSGPTSGRKSSGDRSRPAALRWANSSRTTSRSVRPTSSSTVRTPSAAMCSRTSWAMKRMKLTTSSGLPVNRFRSSGFCVATPTGQVSRWQTRIMMQPMATSGPVAKPNSSAPSRAAMTTSRPVFSWPSVSSRTRLRRLLRTSVWCVSASPNSHGSPACLMLDTGDAPVPPSWPLMRMTSACPLATPAATVPTPTSETSLTLIRAWGLAFFRS